MSRPRGARLLHVAAIVLALVAPIADRAAAGSGSILGDGYPLQIEASFPAGLFHWIDSLAGTSVGKTIPAHQREYDARFGPLDEIDSKHLQAFIAARQDHVRRWPTSSDADRGVPVVSALLGIFCAASSLDDALRQAKTGLSRESFEGLQAALEHFRPRYEKIWKDGIAQKFVKRARDDRERAELASLLGRIAKFYGVTPSRTNPPRLVVVPVPAGYGTHAEAIGRQLLIEVRHGENLGDQAAVVVHENSHYLFGLVPAGRRAELAAGMRAQGDRGQRVWDLLREALPTALGQGIADHQFRPERWSSEDSWYHLADVDALAKAIYPAVNHAVASGGSFDETFLGTLIARLDGKTGPPVRGVETITPR